MKVLLAIEIFAPSVAMHWRALEGITDDIGRQIWSQAYCPKTSWLFDPRDRDAVKAVRRQLMATLPPNLAIREFVMIEDVTPDDVVVADYVDRAFSEVLPGISAGLWPSQYPAHCPSCGNCYVPITDDFPIPMVKLIRRKFLITSIVGCLQLVATSTFHDWYQSAGFTGLTFQRIETGMKKELYRVHVAIHQWADRSGVCSECEMKTSVTHGHGIFNLQELFQYDFQFARCWRDTRMILSQRAFRRVQATKELALPLRSDIMPIPMVPGYMADIIRPEDRVCTPEAPPVRMLAY